MSFFLNRQECVLVLGMHKSGTSVLSVYFQKNGIDILYDGEKRKNRHYPDGYMELEKITKLNESILVYSGGSWDNPPENITWTYKHCIKAQTIVVKSLLIKNKWGIKDPRTLYTLPFWKGILNKISLVGTFRHPVRVAESLCYYNKIPFSRGLVLWEKYNMRLLEYFKEYKFPLISYDLDIKEYDLVMRNILNNLNIYNQKIPVRQIIKNKNTWLSSHGPEEVPVRILRIYKELLNASYLSYKE